MNNAPTYLARGILLAGLFMALLSSAAFAEPAATADEAKISIDIPVSLKQANVVFNMDHVALAGDMPVGMKYMDLLDKKMKREKIPGHIIGVFHGMAAYMTLNDKAYNAERKVSSGNPYKALIENLIASGVQIEECAVSMKGNHWTNASLLPGVKVNSGAVGRIIELTQQGYVQIQP